MRNGASSFVKYVTAFPSLPARPVRPAQECMSATRRWPGATRGHRRNAPLTNSMDVALHALWEVVVDDFSDALEVHASRHDFRADHDPAFPTPHASDGIFPFLASHARMQAVDVRDPIEHELLRERGGARLCRHEHEERWIVRLRQILEKGRKLRRIIRHVRERLRDEG